MTELTGESKISGRPVNRVTEVNGIGKEIGDLSQSIRFKPIEEKINEVQL